MPRKRNIRQTPISSSLPVAVMPTIQPRSNKNSEDATDESLATLVNSSAPPTLSDSVANPEGVSFLRLVVKAQIAGSFLPTLAKARSIVEIKVMCAL